MHVDEWAVFFDHMLTSEGGMAHAERVLQDVEEWVRLGERVYKSFKFLDHDESGQLTPSEIRGILGDDYTTWMIENLDGRIQDDEGHYQDQKADGAIGLKEWQCFFQHLLETEGKAKAEGVLNDIEAWLAPHRPQPRKPQHAAFWARVDNSFLLLDKNNSGDLGEEEVRAVLGNE